MPVSGLCGGRAQGGTLSITRTSCPASPFLGLCSIPAVASALLSHSHAILDPKLPLQPDLASHPAQGLMPSWQWLLARCGGHLVNAWVAILYTGPQLLCRLLPFSCPVLILRSGIPETRSTWVAAVYVSPACGLAPAGENCEVDSRAGRCVPGVCRNGGTCTNSADGGFRCQCPAGGFEAPFCEVSTRSFPPRSFIMFRGLRQRFHFTLALS